MKKREFLKVKYRFDQSGERVVFLSAARVNTLLLLLALLLSGTHYGTFTLGKGHNQQTEVNPEERRDSFAEESFDAVSGVNQTTEDPPQKPEILRPASLVAPHQPSEPDASTVPNGTAESHKPALSIQSSPDPLKIATTERESGGDGGQTLAATQTPAISQDPSAVQTEEVKVRIEENELIVSLGIRNTAEERGRKSGLVRLRIAGQEETATVDFSIKRFVRKEAKLPLWPSWKTPFKVVTSVEIEGEEVSEQSHTIAAVITEEISPTKEESEE